MSDVLVYGAGGFAREVAWLAEDCGHTVVAYIDDNPATHGQRLNGVEIVGLDHAASAFRGASVAIGIGSPAARDAISARTSAAGLVPASLIHPRVARSRWIEIGEGAVICAGSTLTTNIRLGRHVQINLHCTIGHDVVMDDFATLAPGVHVSGWVRLEQRAYMGTGAVVINGTHDNPITIGEGAIVGAGAVVVRDVPPGVTVAGVPAKPLR